MEPWIIVLIIVAVLVLFMLFLMVATRYKKCPPDKIMVIYGKVGADKEGNARSAKCIHGGAAFIWPLVQAFTYLDLTPLSISVDLKSALSRQNIRIDVPSIFTVGISTEPTVMENAAERLRNLKMNEIQELAKDIIFGQLRLVIATMNIEEINTDRDKFLEAISRNVEGELKKIGLRSLWVRKRRRKPSTTRRSPSPRRTRSVPSAKRTPKWRSACAWLRQTARRSRAKTSPRRRSPRRRRNCAKRRRRRSNSPLPPKRCRRQRRSKRATRRKRSPNSRVQEADIIVKQEIEKRRKEIEADAEAEQMRRTAKGEADAIYAKMEAEARGVREKLSKQAEGLDAIVKAAGGEANDAVRLIIADKIEQIVAEQVEAIKNVKIDKVTVWDGGEGKDGKTATAGFLSGLLKSLPPLEEMYNMAGLSLPKIVAPQKEGEKNAETAAGKQAPAPKKAPDKK